MDIQPDSFKISEEEISTMVSARIPLADAQRVAALNGLQSVRTAKSASQQREHARLTAKYGAGDPRVIAMQATIAADQQMQSMIAVEIDYASMAAPAVDANSWTLYGYVRDASMTGVAAMTVALYDDSGTWLRNYKFTCTDANGYFSMKVDASTDGAGATAIIHVVDANKQTMFVDTSAVNITAGQNLFREIILGAKPIVCSAPESGAKDEANGPA